MVDGYDDDPAQEDFHEAIRRFLALDRSVLDAAAQSIFAYYRDVMDDVLADGDDQWYVEIDDPGNVLGHVRLGQPVDQVWEGLDELARVHLLTEQVPGRYTLHDLLRAFARERRDPGLQAGTASW